MTLDHGQRLLIDRTDLRRTALAADPDAPAERPLADGQARLAVDRFALTANNITYASFGQAMHYWQFFPAADAAWGCLPVWGFATVCDSRAEGLAVGRRVYGFLPAGTHLVVQPDRVRSSGFVDAAAHRQPLAAVYNHYSWCDTDPAWQPDTEALQALLRPLFTTSFVLDDFLADNGFFGARQLLLSSASSKTAYGTAFCLAQRRAQPGAARVLGLTSPGNLAFTQGLGCYDQVLAYDALERLDPREATVYVDFAGDAALRARVHQHFGSSLAFSSAIGGTHWQGLGGGGQLPGPRPTLFFAPAQVAKRSAAPPEGWGAGELQRRLGQAWQQFLQAVGRPEGAWLRVEAHSGGAALQAAYAELLDGRADPQRGLMLGGLAQGLPASAG